MPNFFSKKHNYKKFYFIILILFISFSKASPFISPALAQVFNPYFQSLLNEIKKENTSSQGKFFNTNYFIKPISTDSFNDNLTKLLEERNFGNIRTESNFEKPVLSDGTAVSFTQTDIKRNSQIMENRQNHIACDGSDDPVACRRDFFVACSAAFEDNEKMPSQCGNFSATEYADFIVYGRENPENSVEEYYYDKSTTGEDLLINAKYDNDTKFRELFSDPEKNGKSGWATWFGHGPGGQFDPLKGTAQFGGWTGLCGSGNKNPGCYQTRNTKTCIISLPGSTVKDFYGIDIKDKNTLRSFVDSKPMIEIKNTANNTCTTAPLGDIGPGESTGKAADLTGCVMKQLGGSGMIHAHFRPLKDGEKGCEDKKVKELSFGGIVEKVITCNCDKPDKNVVVVSDKTNRKRLVGVFLYENVANFSPKEGDEILGVYSPSGSKVTCAIRQKPNDRMCIQKTKGISGNYYEIITVAGKIIKAGNSKKETKI